MTTPTSVLGMSAIQTEFGGSNPIALSEYYGVNANVPGSGTIRMAQFLGISAGPSVSLPANTAITAAHYEISTSNAWVNFASSGNYSFVGSGTLTWLTSGSSSQVDIHLRYVSGTNAPSGSALSAWLNLGTTRQWQLINTVDGTQKTASCVVTLRNATTLANLISRTVEFISEAEK
jgi:hypothetical protein